MDFLKFKQIFKQFLKTQSDIQFATLDQISDAFCEDYFNQSILRNDYNIFNEEDLIFMKANQNVILDELTQKYLQIPQVRQNIGFVDNDDLIIDQLKNLSIVSALTEDKKQQINLIQ